MGRADENEQTRQRYTRSGGVPGIAVLMTGAAGDVPNVLLYNLKHNKVLHETVLFVTVVNEDIPVVPEGRHAEVTELAPRIRRAILRCDFQEMPHGPR